MTAPTDLDGFNLQGLHVSLDPPQDDDPGRAHLGIYVTLREADQTHKTVEVTVPADATDAQIAGAMVQAICGVGAMRGTLLAAVRARMADL